MSNTVTSLIKLTKSDAVVGRMKELLHEKAPEFLTSMINTVKSNPLLLECDQQKLMAEVFKAAVLDLTIEPSLGQSCIVPFKNWKTGEQIPTFIVEVKGWVQLAQRSGKIKSVNLATVYEDEIKKYNPILETIEFKEDIPENSMRDDPKVDPIGYYADFTLLNGFFKQTYWTRKRVMNHAIRYVPSWDKKNLCFYKNSFWEKDFDSQGKKTVLKQLLSRWAPISTRVLSVLKDDEKPIVEQPNLTPEPEPKVIPENKRPEAKKVEKKAPKPKDKDVIDNPHEPVKEPVHGKVEPEPPKEKDPFD